MSENGTEKQSGFFQFNWAAFNVIAGIKFAVGVLVMVLLTTFTDFDFLIILIASFLAWLTDVPATTKNRVMGMVVFGVAGTATLWLAATVLSSLFWFTTAMFVVAFVFTLPMALSQRGYMVGWVDNPLVLFHRADDQLRGRDFDHVGPPHRGRYCRRDYTAVAGGYRALRTSPST